MAKATSHSSIESSKPDRAQKCGFCRGRGDNWQKRDIDTTIRYQCPECHGKRRVTPASQSILMRAKGIPARSNNARGA
jgi:DnaJ-class molecular chaperone